jgi:hypothetical protein
MCPSPAPRPDEPAPSRRSKRAARYLPNPACRITGQVAEPVPDDLGWCIRRRWRLLYYAYRHAAGLPLWDGAKEFERLMALVLGQLSRGFEPIAPLCVARPEDPMFDPRTERLQQSSCRTFRAPRLDQPDFDD